MSPDQNPRTAFPEAFGAIGYALVCLVVLAGGIEIVSLAIMSIHNSRMPRPFYEGHCRGLGGGKCGNSDIDLDTASSTYDQSEWAESYWREERDLWGRTNDSSFKPFVVWGNPRWSGRLLNFDQTEFGVIRRTANPTPGCPNVIWMFGGSTMRGLGSPDEMTIASYLSRDLNSGSAPCVTVVNLGCDGYNTNQELVLLLELLKSGQRPAMAIFYDGANEVLVGTQSTGHTAFFGEFEFKTQLETPATVPAVLRGLLLKSNSVALTRIILRHMGEWQDSFKATMRRVGLTRARLHRAVPQPNLPPQGPTQAGPTAPPMRTPERLGAEVLDNYDANRKLIQALGQEFGLRVLFFWQPAIYYGNKPLDSFESQAVRWTHADDVSRAGIYREAERRSPGQYVFLGHMLDSIREPLYSDDVHLGPEGNRLVAERIAQVVREAAFAKIAK